MTSDQEAMTMRANQLTDESLDATRRMVAQMEECQDYGIRTLVALDEQGEQLERIEDAMNTVNKDMRDAEKNLAGLEKCCGLCACPWQKGKTPPKDDEYKRIWKKNQDGKVVSSQPMNVADDRNAVTIGGPMIKRVTNDAREDEMEENLGQVSSCITNLKHMALDMNNEINSQNVTVERLNAKVHNNNDRIKAANQRAITLLNN
ncbi:unnamed protein product [Oikopleura dioica]|uniref:Synaptosomal-associated protein n=1 Tax=Oikopleura dioica TaxID=34765 RepID=Q675Z9_OIKDI|nr:synaptosomal-associated protein 25 [Oikopleura dioica]CBY21774.1 unnamed protein product [Oikopleura dioica]